MLHRKNEFRVASLLEKGLLCLFALASAEACSHEGGAPPASSPSGAASPAATASQQDLGQGGASVFVVHMMSDFDAFKKYFEEGAAEREKAGIKGYLLSRLDDGTVVIHLFADDLEEVQNALNSPDLERYLDRKGSPETSLVWLTKNDVVKVPAVPPAGETFSLYLKLHVGDFAALERGFEERHAVFAEQGVIGEGLHQSTDREGIAILHFMGTAKDKLEALPKRAEFVELLKHAKVEGEVKPLMGVDLARNRPK
jgi:hypothetical protein